MTNAFITNDRKPLTRQQKAKLFLEHDGRCYKCNRQLRPGDIWTDEHDEALCNGGGNEWSNRRVICAWCRPAKDRSDSKRAAKTRHQATNYAVPTATKKGSRQTFLTNRNGPFKKKMDGTVEKRS